MIDMQAPRHGNGIDSFPAGIRVRCRVWQAHSGSPFYTLNLGTSQPDTLLSLCRKTETLYSSMAYATYAIARSYLSLSMILKAASRLPPYRVVLQKSSSLITIRNLLILIQFCFSKARSILSEVTRLWKLHETYGGAGLRFYCLKLHQNQSATFFTASLPGTDIGYSVSAASA